MPCPRPETTPDEMKFVEILKRLKHGAQKQALLYFLPDNYPTHAIPPVPLMLLLSSALKTRGNEEKKKKGKL